MDRSPSILKSLVAAVLLTSGLLGAGAALAQRAITNSAAGNDDPPVVRTFDRLGDCSVRNTRGLVAGEADACAGATQFGETLSAIRGLAADYSDTRPYDLVLSNETPDRLAGADTISSGGLFRSNGLGSSFVGLVFERDRVGSFILAASGHYSNTGTNGQSLAFSSYYLFDNVEIDARGFMPVRLFDVGSQIRLLPDGSVVYVETADYTQGMSIEQISIYDLQRVPEAGSLALVSLALTTLAMVRRRRHRPTA